MKVSQPIIRETVREITQKMKLQLVWYMEENYSVIHFFCFYSFASLCAYYSSVYCVFVFSAIIHRFIIIYTIISAFQTYALKFSEIFQ